MHTSPSEAGLSTSDGIEWRLKNKDDTRVDLGGHFIIQSATHQVVDYQYSALADETWRTHWRMIIHWPLDQSLADWHDWHWSLLVSNLLLMVGGGGGAQGSRGKGQLTLSCLTAFKSDWLCTD